MKLIKFAIFLFFICVSTERRLGAKLRLENEKRSLMGTGSTSLKQSDKSKPRNPFLLATFHSKPKDILESLEILDRLLQKHINPSSIPFVFITIEETDKDYLITDKILEKAKDLEEISSSFPMPFVRKFGLDFYEKVFLKSTTLIEFIENFSAFVKKHPKSEFPSFKITADFLKGDVLKIKKLGSGGFGEVYEEIIDGELCATKYLQKGKGLVTDPANRKEMAYILSLNDSNIIKINGFDKERIIMEYAYESLEDLIDREYSNIDNKGLVLILKQIASGLVKIHEGGIIHGDIKPENILIDSEFDAKFNPNPRCIISDFGLSSFASLPNKKFGFTPLYMAPELVEISREINGKTEDNAIDQKNDVYSFGLLIYYAFLKEIPFSNFKSKEAIEDAKLAGYIPSFSDLGITDEEIPKWLQDLQQLIKNCCEKDMEKRYTMKEVYDSIDKMLKEDEWN